MNERLSVKASHTPRRHSDISALSKSKDHSNGSRLLIPKSGSKSAGNSKSSLNLASSVSLDLKTAVSPPSPVSPKRSVTFNPKVQVFEHTSWKKQLKRYRKIARKLLAKKEQLLKDLKDSKQDQESSDSSSDEEETKTDSMVSTGMRTPPRISIN